ncbi:MAG: hypothetical protein H7839_22340 [Magnetococcus sp. YQC-5]
MKSKRFILRLWFGVFLLNLLVAGWAVFILNVSFRTHVESAEIVTQNLALMLEREISIIFASTDLSLRSMVDDYDDKNHSLSNKWKSKLYRLKPILQMLADLGAINAQGTLIWGGVADALILEKISDYDFFMRHRDQPNAGLVISSPIYSHGTQQWLLVLSRRLNDSSGTFSGIVAATISLKIVTAQVGHLQTKP